MIDKKIHEVVKGLNNVLFNDFEKFNKSRNNFITPQPTAWAWYYAEESLYIIRHEEINVAGNKHFTYFFEYASSPADALLKATNYYFKISLKTLENKKDV